MNLADWRNSAHQKLQSFARAIDNWAPKLIYGAMAGLSLLPITAAADPRQALVDLIGSVGGNLLANLLETWKTQDDNDDEKSLAEYFTKAAKADEATRAALDQLLLKLDALESIIPNLNADEREDHLRSLNTQFKKIGSTISIENYVNLMISGDATNSNVIAGNNNTIQMLSVTAEAFQQTFRQYAPSSTDLQQATERYLKYLWHRYSILDIKGMGMLDRALLKLPLLDMYIPLQARIELPEGETWTRGLRLAGRQLSDAEATVLGERMGEPQPLLDLLNRVQGLVILGDPGAGKTTFLKYLALRLALGQATEIALEQRLPVLVPLSEYARALATGRIALQDFIEHYFQQQGNAELQVAHLLHAALKSGRALLLFDGLDEVQQRRDRAYVINQVENFIAHHCQTGNKFVLTSRIVGYKDAPLSAPNVQCCTLIDFDDADMADFVGKWSKVQEQAIKGASEVSSSEAETQKSDLLETLRANRAVHDLATNPLLLTILALMQREGIKLPDRRVQLYDKYIEVLLSSWQLARSLAGPQPDLRTLDVVENLQLLGPLALWMQESSPGQGLVQRHALETKLTEIYAKRGEPRPQAAAAQLLTDARSAANLLIERGHGEYGFIHLTFMEYLAAIGIAQQGQLDIQPIVDTLAAHIGESNWHEVLLLTIGYLGIILRNEQAASEVLLALLDRKPGEAREAVILAGEAVADARAGGVTPACRQRVVQALLATLTDDVHVTPVRRARAGRALAHLGDPRENVMTLEGMEFCYVPPGPFIMGSSDDDPDAFDDEKPQHEYNIPYGYWIGRYPVSNAQFQYFVDAGGYQDPTWWSEAIAQGVWRDGQVWRLVYKEIKDNKTIYQDKREAGSAPFKWREPFNLPNLPAVGISWYEALAFTRWWRTQFQAIGLLPEGWDVHLPNEPEWEKSARGGFEIPTLALVNTLANLTKINVNSLTPNISYSRTYPWGNEVDVNHMNFKQTLIESPSTIGIFPGSSSPYGVEELIGNVWEWTQSLWGEKPYKVYGYPYQTRDGRENLDFGNEVRLVARGGGFFNSPQHVRCAIRTGCNPADRNNHVVLRLVISPSTATR